MRLLNQLENKTMKKVLLFLTKGEAEELRDTLNILLEDTSEKRHEHVSDLEYLHELTVSLYSEHNVDKFDARSVEIIQRDI